MKTPNLEGSSVNHLGNDRGESDSFPWSRIAFVFVIVFVFALIVGVIPWVTFCFRPEWAKKFPSEAGLWGDSFGFVNAILSALGFAGVLVTLWMQRRELQLQREEMRMTRQELEATRTEHSRMAKSQEESENRLFLAAYMNALESLRQLSQWRMTDDPARQKGATYPVVEGLVIQARVSQSLQILVRDLEPQVRLLHPTLTVVTEEGSRVWILEKLLNIYIALRGLIESHGSRAENLSSFQEAVNIAQIQFDILDKQKDALSPGFRERIDVLLTRIRDPNLLSSEILSEGADGINRRKIYFNELEQSKSDLLNLIMTMCYE